MPPRSPLCLFSLSLSFFLSLPSLSTVATENVLAGQFSGPPEANGALIRPHFFTRSEITAFWITLSSFLLRRVALFHGSDLSSRTATVVPNEAAPGASFSPLRGLTFGVNWRGYLSLTGGRGWDRPRSGNLSIP